MVFNSIIHSISPLFGDDSVPLARAKSPKPFYIFSPCIVAKTFLLCFAFLNSRNHMPCQVPVANLPFEIGMLTLAPMSDDLMCAYHCPQSAITSNDSGAEGKLTGISSEPSASCL